MRIHKSLMAGLALLIAAAGPSWSESGASEAHSAHDHAAHQAEPPPAPDPHAAHRAGHAMPPDPHAGHDMGHAKPDPHAAHRAALKNSRYSVTTESYAVPDVELIDELGAPVALRTLLGAEEPLALNFIFTTCTTICPVMTSTFAQMRRDLGDSAGQVRLVSISIDPEYDRPAVLKEYAGRFGAGEGWTFLTGDSADVSQVLHSFKAYNGSKMNHQPITLLKSPGSASWVRIDGLASGQDLANEVTARLLN